MYKIICRVQNRSPHGTSCVKLSYPSPSMLCVGDPLDVCCWNFGILICTVGLVRGWRIEEEESWGVVSWFLIGLQQCSVYIPLQGQVRWRKGMINLIIDTALGTGVPWHGQKIQPWHLYLVGSASYQSDANSAKPVDVWTSALRYLHQSKPSCSRLQSGGRIIRERRPKPWSSLYIPGYKTLYNKHIHSDHHRYRTVLCTESQVSARLIYCGRYLHPKYLIPGPATVSDR